MNEFLLNSSGLSNEDIELLASLHKDTMKFAKVYAPDTFRKEFSEQHKKIFDIIDNSGAKKIAIAAPRGIGKTSIVKILATKYMCFRDFHFVAYIGKSESHAMLQTEGMKRSMISNKMLKATFGDPRAVEETSMQDFSKKSWVAFENTLVMPRGSGMQVRGLLWGDYRLDFIGVDDLEDTKTISNELIRAARYDWFFSDVMYSVPQLDDAEYRIIYIDTIKHPDSLLSHLLDDPDWESIRLSACDEHYHTLFPGFYPQPELDKILERHRRTKTMDLFAMEFQSLPTSPEDASLTAASFRYYSETDEEFNVRRRAGKIESVVIVDPAKTAKMHNDESGFCVWGIDTEVNAMYLRYSEGAHVHPDELVEHAFELADQFECRSVAVEVTGLEEFITFPFRNEMIRRGRIYDIIELRARRGSEELSGPLGGKIARIRTLFQYYRKGLVFHNKVNCGPYEQALLSFPKPVRWDVIDAGAYITQVLEMGLRYFQPKDQGDDVDALEAEYECLEDEPVEYDWVVA